MLAPAKLRGGIVTFLADRTFAVITARDAAGSLWSSPLIGKPFNSFGNLSIDPTAALLFVDFELSGTASSTWTT